MAKGGYLQDVQLCPGGDFSEEGIEGGFLRKTLKYMYSTAFAYLYDLKPRGNNS